MFPDADLRYLNKVAARMAMVVKPVRSVEPRLLDPITLIKIGIGIMNEVATQTQPGFRDANRFRVACRLFQLIHSAVVKPHATRMWR